MLVLVCRCLLMVFVWSKRSCCLHAALAASEQGCCLSLSCMCARDLVHDICNACLVLDDSRITFGFEVAVVVAACVSAVSVCASAGSVSTMSGTAGALFFSLGFYGS